MVNQCANPDCKRELHYLREERIYLFALSTSTGTRQIEHFWLPSHNVSDYAFRTQRI